MTVSVLPAGCRKQTIPRYCVSRFINLINVIYLAVPVDELGTRWQGWAVVVATPAAAMLLLLYFQEVYKRSDADLVQSKGRASVGSE